MKKIIVSLFLLVLASTSCMRGGIYDNKSKDNLLSFITLFNAYDAVITSSVTGPTNDPTITFTITFGEPVTGFDISDITIGGTGNATVTSVTPVGADGTTYTITITPTADGQISIGVADGAALKPDSEPTGYIPPSTVTYDSAVNPITASIQSNNTNPDYARVGSRVTVSFTAGEELLMPAATINGHTATITGGPVNWAASYVMTNTDPEVQVTFEISGIQDLAGNTAANETTVDDGSSVTFDMTAPTVTMQLITSTNATPTYARTGDTIIINFQTNETIQTPTVTVSGSASAVTGPTTDWNTTRVMLDSDAEGQISYAISNLQDLAGNAAADITGTPGIVFDRTAPGFSGISPASNSVTSDYNVAYRLSEACASGSITWTETGGNDDPAGAPAVHTYALSGTELTSGVHNLTLGTITLNSGTIYSVQFSGADMAGNSGAAASTGVTYNDATLPTLSTTAAMSITDTSATSGGNITSAGGTAVTARGVCWNTSGSPTISDNLTSDGSGTGIFTSNITGLTSNTLYYVRAYATNASGTAYGDETMFTTLPALTTTAVSAVTTTTAGSGGTIDAGGGAVITERGVCWNTSGGATTSDSHTSETPATGTYTSAMTGLASNTVYYMRAYATNAGGTAYGNQIMFTTLAEVSTAAPSSVTDTTATSGGTITDGGGAAITERGTCWNTTGNPTIADSRTSDGNTTGTYASSIAGLTPNTMYYSRAYSTNAGGTSYGAEVTFTTNYPPLAGLSYTTPQVIEAGIGAIITPTLDPAGYVYPLAYSVTPALPAGLSLNTATGLISGTPTAETAAADYIVTATNSGGSRNATVNITVNYPALAGLTYISPQTLDVGTVVSITPTLDPAGYSYPLAYSVTPALPAGLTLNAATGEISGTPTAEAAAADYIVTATNSGGSRNATVNITVNYPALAGLTYISPQTLDVGTVVSITPTLDPAGYSYPLTYSVTPALPAGLSLNTATGLISGTPTAETAAADYIVTATNSGGPQSFTINITVNYPPLAGLSYASPQNLVVGIGINIMPTLDPTTYAYPLAFSVMPPLPTGMTLNPSTGEITGVPAAEQVATVYTVTAGNSGGSQSFDINITVNPQLATLTTTLPVYSTLTQADTGGTITDTGGGAITQRGVCWNLTGSPTTGDSCTTDGPGGTGAFTSTMTTLLAGTTYHVRAYAINGAGTAYGDELTYLHGTVTPQLTTVSISSSNGNPLYAIPGKIVTLTIVSDIAIQAPSVSIAGHDELDGVSVTGFGTNWQATYTMAGGDTEGVIPFEISNIQSLLGTPAPNVTATTDSTSITFDRTVPEVSIGTPSQTLINGSGSVDFVVNYSGADTVNLTILDLSLSTTGGANCGNFNVTNGASMAPTVTLSNCTGTGTVRLSIDPGTSSDTAGNTDLGAGPSVFFTVDATAPNITPGTFLSSNPINSTYARDGHTITVQFTTDEAVALPTVSIGMYPATITDPTGGGTGMTWEATYAVASGSDEVVGYSISVADQAGNLDSATASGGVTIDNTAPTIDHVEKWPADNVYGEGETITIQVQFVESVRLTGGSMDVTLNTTPANAVVNFNAPWGPTNFISMGYQVQAGYETANLKVVSIGTSGGQIVDEAGNEMTVFTGFTNYPDGIVLDGVAPVVEITAPTANAHVNGDAIISFTDDDPNTPEVSLDNGLSWDTVTNGVTRLSDLSHFIAFSEGVEFTLSVRDIDAAGNEDVDAITLYKDTIPPNITNISFTSNNPTYNTYARNGHIITLTFTTDNTGTTPSVQIAGNAVTPSGGPTDWTATYTVSGLAEGDYGYAITLADQAGNIATDTTSTGITIDNTAPQVAEISSETAGGIHGVNADINIRVTFNEPVILPSGRTIAMQLAGMSNQVFINPFSNLDFVDSTYTVAPGDSTWGAELDISNIWLNGGPMTDLAGNEQYTLVNPPVYTFAYNEDIYIDGVAPTVAIDNPGGGADFSTSTAAQTISGTCSADATMTGTTLGTFSDSDCSDGNWSLDVTLPAEGPHTITVTATDAAMNTGNDSMTITYDVTAPTTTIDNPNSGNDYSTNAATQIISGTCSTDATMTGTTEGAFIDSDCADGLWALEVTLSGEGLHTITVTATDAAMNTGNDSMTITYDVTVPTVVIDNPNSGNDYSTNAAAQIISGTCSSDATMTGTTLGTFSDSDCSDGNWSLDVTLPAEGPHTITVTATDAAMNTGNDSMTITYDVTAPTVVINSTEPNPTSVSPIPITITFSEAVTGFNAGSITVTNGVVSNLLGSGANYTAEIYPSTPGFVYVDIGAGAAIDTAGNPNTAATQFSIEYGSPDINVRRGIVDYPATGSTYGFGRVQVGQSKSVTFTVENAGTGTLSLVSVGVSDTTNFSVTIPGPEFSQLDAGTSTTITVTFAPQTTGTFGTSPEVFLDISSTDLDEGSYTIGLTGEGVAAPVPDIDVRVGAVEYLSGDTYTFDTVMNTHISRATFMIVNSGVGGLEISGISLASGSRYAITEGPGAMSIPGGGATTFTVEYIPQSSSPETDVLTIISNDPDTGYENNYIINLTGHGYGSDLPTLDITIDGVEYPTGSLYDFGFAGAGGSNGPVTFTITNNGYIDLDIYDLLVDVEDNTVFVVSGPATTLIPPSGMETFTVTFAAPGVTGPYSTVLTINSNTEPYTLNLNGGSVSSPVPDINVEADSQYYPSDTWFDFGGELIGGSGVTVTFTVENFGTGADLNPNFPILSGVHMGDYTLDTTSYGGPVAYGNGTCTFDVTFTPGGEGLRSAVIEIPNDDPDENPYVIHLIGAGVMPLRVVHGGGNGSTSVYNPIDNTFSDDFLSMSNGVSSGAHSFRIPSGTYANQYMVIHGNYGGGMGATLYDPSGPSITNYSAGTGAVISYGAHSFMMEGGAYPNDFIVINGGGSPGMRRFDPDMPGSFNSFGYTFSPGIGSGSFIFKNLDNNLVIVHGNNNYTYQVFNQSAGTLSPTYMIDGTASIGDGGHCVKLTSGAYAGWMLIIEGGSARTWLFEPTSTPTITSGPNIPSANTPKTGSFSIPIKSGTYAGQVLIVHGGDEYTTSIYSPDSGIGTIADGPSFTNGYHIGEGAFAFPITGGTYKGMYMIVHGAYQSETTIFDPFTMSFIYDGSDSLPGGYTAGPGAHCFPAR